MQHLNKNGDFYYTDLYEGLTGSGGITIEDLIPVSGSLAETTGAYVRIAELLSGSSGSSGGTYRRHRWSRTLTSRAPTPTLTDPDVNDPQIPVKWHGWRDHCLRWRS